MQAATLITTHHLVKHYPIGGRQFTALKDINVAIQKGEFTGLVGPSGSGKTTLLNIIGALDDPSEGDAIVIGQDTGALSHKQAARLRSEHLGFIFQTYNLLPVYTVFENVEFPLLLLGMSDTARKQAVMQALEWVGLTDKVRSRPAQLSGGESQRVAIARAMVKQPELVLADEPTANLDAANSHNILHMMLRLNQELQSTFLFATHDEKVIRYLRRQITLKDGKIVDDVEKTPQLD
ncbi:ATP-binding cassette domain-containing protein [candidate division KSB3 bacterium]|uniref:ATP-binding cassette domain-containing protein n=1 Tax=candidate division KSB3 bacterium TaxID=2044937 RepID=A0A9D5JSY3_9BACT|nr:ATP-binding cassette domain-containing protein [candidate division KSB3 bacterium]MBD3323036.1 ATP-binding cassette domain-containing protein [candidate division KSB3 bacterium]